MAPFSVAALTTSCASIAGRALSAASELVECPQPLLPEVSALLRRLSADASGLEELAPKCSAVSAAVQSGLPAMLHTCERALATMDKQLRRLVSIDPQWTIDDDVVASYTGYLEHQSELFSTYMSLLGE